MAELQPSDVLFIPNRRRLTHALLQGANGRENLHIFYGGKEIIFREPELLPFGNQLLKVERFKAEEARTWSAEPYEWEKVRGLLEALIGEEIVKVYDEKAAAPQAVQAYPAQLGRNPEGRGPATYSMADAARCPHLTQQTLGKPLELGNLEVGLPIHRVAHPAMDKDGRQVGENNVADPLFLDIPTERKQCNFAGSRYHADVPINATAMKHMSRRWPELLSLTEQYRTAFFEHLPPQDPKALRAGEVHLLAVGCLSMVGYVMVRGVDPVQNGQLDAGLAAAFRLIDGVRIVTTEMVRDTAGNHSCDRIVDGKAIHDYAERTSLFIDRWGVCAGPAALIDEYMHVLLDGQSAPIKAEPDLAARVGDLKAAFEYALHGSRNESMVRAYGAVQGQLHERLRRAFAAHPGDIKLREIVAVPFDREHYPNLRINHSLEETLQMEIRVCRWLFARARQGLPQDLPGALDVIDDLWRIDPAEHARNLPRISAFLSRAAPGFADLPEALRQEVAAVATEFLAMQRNTLHAVAAEQRHLNRRLRRPPGPALNGDDISVYDRRSTPALVRVLGEGLGLTIEASMEETVLKSDKESLSLAD